MLQVPIFQFLDVALDPTNCLILDHTPKILLDQDFHDLLLAHLIYILFHCNQTVSLLLFLDLETELY